MNRNFRTRGELFPSTRPSKSIRQKRKRKNAVQDVSIHRAQIRACILSDTISRDFNLSTKFLFVNVDLFLHVDKFEKPLHFSRSRNCSMYCLSNSQLAFLRQKCKDIDSLTESNNERLCELSSRNENKYIKISISLI